MKTLKDVAGLYKSKVLENIQSGPNRAYKTGNLYNRIDSSNQAASMVKVQKKGKEIDDVTFTINISPNGAQYGQYVHNGTYKMKARPFAKSAAQDTEFQNVMNEFMNGYVGDRLQDWSDNISKDFKKAGFTIS